MSGNNSSYELDQLEPTPGDGILKLNAEELTCLFLHNQLGFNNGVKVSIWGDWVGRKLDIKHELKLIDFNPDDNEVPF